MVGEKVVHFHHLYHFNPHLHSSTPIINDVLNDVDVDDNNQIPSSSSGDMTNIATANEMELPECSGNNVSIMENKQGGEILFSPVKTRKRKRDASFLSPKGITPIVGSGYKIIHSDILQDLVSMARCSSCNSEKSLILKQDNKKKKSMCETLLLFCNFCKVTLKSTEASKLVVNKSSNLDKQSKIIDVNLRSVIATTSSGGGLTSLRRFCSNLNFPEPVTENSYNRYLHHLDTSATKNCERSMSEAARELRSLTLSIER